MTALPDMKLVMDDILIQGDRADYHWTLSGTNSGPGETRASSSHQQRARTATWQGVGTLELAFQDATLSMSLFQQDWQFILSLLSIVLVDLTLSGDNAVVIAAAAKSLPGPLRKRAMIAGAGCAVIALVTAAFFVTGLLQVKFLQIVGGVAVLWIAIGLFREEPPSDASAKQLSSFWKAMWFIIVADVTMSTDNVLAIAALAHGSLALLLFGLGISIPLVVFASGLLATLMDKYPVIIYIGGGLLGRVAGQMIMTDAFTVQRFAPSATLRYSVEAAGATGVLIAGWWMKTRAKERVSR